MRRPPAAMLSMLSITRISTHGSTFMRIATTQKPPNAASISRLTRSPRNGTSQASEARRAICGQRKP
jgi:hypothetical protein